MIWETNQYTRPIMSKSLLFFAFADSVIQVPHGDNISIAFNQNFTIEWFQYQYSGKQDVYLFHMGPVASVFDGIPPTDIPAIRPMNLGVSFNSNTLYVTIGDRGYAIPLSPSDYLDRWAHFAISRKSSTIRVFVNGVLCKRFASRSAVDNYMLYFGNYEGGGDETAFDGILFDFLFTKGIAKYTETFQVPTSSPTIINGNTQFYITGDEIVGEQSENVIINSVAPFSFTPFNQTPPSEPEEPPPPDTPVQMQYRFRRYVPWRRMQYPRILFYNTGSLTSGGVGPISNWRVKQRRT